MKQPPMSLKERLELAAQACRAAGLLSCEETCREASSALPAEGVASGCKLPASHYDKCPVCDAPTNAGPARGHGNPKMADAAIHEPGPAPSVPSASGEKT